MEYTPTLWDCGDVVTAEKLNKIEEALEALAEASGGGGSDSGIFWVKMVSEETGVIVPVRVCPTTIADYIATYDKTYQEVLDAVSADRLVAFLETDGNGSVGFGYISSVKFDGSFVNLEDDRSREYVGAPSDTIQYVECGGLS